MSYAVAILLWLLMLFASYPYVKRVRHPDQHLLAAYMIFISIFSAASFFFFALLSRIVVIAGWTTVMEEPGPVLLMALLSFVPAFYLARWQTRKPGMDRPAPP